MTASSLSRTRLSRSRRAARALPGAALGVLLVAGCGQAATSPAAGSAPTPSATAGAAAAAEPAAATSSAVTPAALAGRVAAALQGVRSGTAAFTAASGGAVLGSATVSGDATAEVAQATATVDGQRYQLRAVDGSLYVSGPALAQLTRGKTWARVDDTTLAGLAAGKARTAGPSASPSALPQPRQLAALVAQAVSVRDLGPATVAGTAGHAYRISLPVAALAQVAAAPGLGIDAAQRAQLRQGIDALAAQGVTVLSADLTLDARDRPLQLAATTPALAGGVPTVRLTATFSGWGAPVRVAAPAAADVRTLTAAELSAAARSAAGRQAVRPTASPTS